MSAAAETLFQQVEHEHGMRAPSPIRCSAAEWDAHCRKVWAKFPAWAFDEGYVAALARDHLPNVLAQMGIGPLLGRISDPAHCHAVAGRGAPLMALPTDPDGRWLLLRVEPGSAHLLILDEAGHAWRCPSLARRGASVIELGAWRWGVSEAKAAHRIARICGQRRPVP